MKLIKHKDSMEVVKVNMRLLQKKDEGNSSSIYKSFEDSSAYDIQPGQTLVSGSSGYLVKEIIGAGSFGKVVRCQNLETKEKVAVKIVKRRKDAFAEIEMLRAISVLNPEKSNIVKFIDWFEYKQHVCIVFECLDKDLLDLVISNRSMALIHIRCIAKQLLEAFVQLKDVGIIHTDIKPDNVAVVDLNDKFLRVKLLDFGIAIPTTDVQPGMKVQAVGYRAPEVSLGLPFTEAIDIWGLGCVLACLYLGGNFFPFSEYHTMKQIVEVLGQPEDHLLNAGLYTDRFFINEAANGPTWRLRTPEEFTARNKIKLQNIHTDHISCLDELHDLRLFLTKEEAEYEDRYQFVDLMKQLLRVDGEKRITARQALQHPFITMEHMTKHKDSIYVALSKANMISSSSHTSGQESSGLCDGAPVTSSNNKDLKAYISEGDSPPVPPAWFSCDKVLPVSSPCYSSGEIPPVIEEEPDICSSDEDMPPVPAAWHSGDKVLPDSAPCYSNGEVPPVIEVEEPDESLSCCRMMPKIFCRFCRRIRNLFHRRKRPKA